MTFFQLIYLQIIYKDTKYVRIIESLGVEKKETRGRQTHRGTAKVTKLWIHPKWIFMFVCEGIEKKIKVTIVFTAR